MRRIWYYLLNKKLISTVHLLHICTYKFYFSRLISGATPATLKRKGRKSNKLIVLEQARQQKESGKVNVEFDEVETYKAVGDEASHFNNAIGMSVRGLLKPYLFRWTDQSTEDRDCIWPQISSQFELKDSVEMRASVERQSRKSLAEWKHDLHTHWRKMVEEHGEEAAKNLRHHSCDLTTWQRYITHINSERFQVNSTVIISILLFSFANCKC